MAVTSVSSSKVISTEKKILTFSDRILRKTLLDLKIDDNNIEELVLLEIPNYFICIRGKGDKAIFKNDHKNVLNLIFDDVTFDQNGLKMFDIKQAEIVLNFIDNLKQLNSFYLIVQCQAGISRSGAIADFACTRLELEYKSFKILNPTISPNPKVISLLKYVVEQKEKKNKKEEIPLQGEEIGTLSEQVGGTDVPITPQV